MLRVTPQVLSGFVRLVPSVSSSQITICFLVGAVVVLATAGVASGDSPIREDATVRFDDANDTVQVEYRYAVPLSVSKVEVSYRSLDTTRVSVSEVDGADRMSNTTFRLDGGDDPRIVLEVDPTRHDVNAPFFGAEDAAFTRIPPSYIRYWYSRGSPPGISKSRSFDGEGVAGENYAYAGTHDLYTRTGEGVRWNVVTSDLADESVDAEDIVDLYEQGERLTRSAREYDEVTVFVMPAEQNSGWTSGKAVGTDVYVKDSVASVDGPDNTLAHEYFHVRFGGFRGDETAWVTEGAAEYYGQLLELNTGHRTYEQFRRAVTTDGYEDAVLTEVERYSGGRAEYEKGPHVVAALDAEIRRQTDGEATLQDVIVDDGYDRSSYDEFRGAVVDATGNESMGQWLDTYVRTDALPPIPDEREYFTLGDRTAADFATPKPTPTPVPTATPSPTATPVETTTEPTPAATEMASPERSTEPPTPRRDGADIGVFGHQMVPLYGAVALLVVALLGSRLRSR